MFQFVMSLLTAFWGTYFAIKLIKPLAIKYQLVDMPSGRKVHNGNVPLVGGISVFIGFALSLLCLEQNYLLSLKYFLLAAGGILIVGVLDDKFDISARRKMFCQIVAASVIMFVCNQKLESLGNLLGMGEINLGWFSVPFTYLAILGCINAFNMLDGIDGLVGGVLINTMLSLTLLFASAGFFYETWISLSLLSGILPFLLFNLTNENNPKLKKIFMGDAGSMFLGLSVVWLLTVGTQGNHIAFKPVTALWIIAIPLMDMTGVIIRRKKNGKSPFKPDRDHLHHIFLKAGFTSKQTLLFITITSFCISIIGIFLEIIEVPEVVSFILFILFFIAYTMVIKHIAYLVTTMKSISGYSERF